MYSYLHEKLHWFFPETRRLEGKSGLGKAVRGPMRDDCEWLLACGLEKLVDHGTCRDWKDHLVMKGHLVKALFYT